MNRAIGIDLGGTNIKAAAVDASGTRLGEASLPTRDGEFDGDIPRFALAIRDLIRDLENSFGAADAVGISAPGLAAPDARRISCIPGKMQGLENFDWPDFLSRPSPVVVLNDAHGALLGEVWVGAAAGKKNVVMFTIGTGVGGAILCDGHLIKGHIGRAGHLGHLSVGAELDPDVTGIPGGLERYISEEFIKTLDLEGVGSTKDLAEAARAGNSRAAEEWTRSLRRFAVAITSTINTVDPEVVIIGGGAAMAGDFLFGPLEKFLDDFEWRPQGHRVQLVPAQLGSNAGAFGAAKAGFDALSDSDE